jgi:energy-coupling factor transporter ATP-binding protein EcfA2
MFEQANRPSTSKAYTKKSFYQGHAFIIGIEKYQNLQLLQTPENDIKAIGNKLEQDFNYHVEPILNPSMAELKQFFDKTIPQILAQQATYKPEQAALEPDIVEMVRGIGHAGRQKGEDTEESVLIYFAGHGVALESMEGPKGFLIPADATGDPKTWYPMSEMLDAINRLTCRHLLLIMDCCFGGTMRWASKHRSAMAIPIAEKITKQHYKYFTENRSWQVLTSTAPNQTALDFIGHGSIENHSPFAKCLLDGLDTHADANGDKVITAAELYNYLKERVDVVTATYGHKQSVGYFPLEKHDNGEFLLFLDGFNPDELKPSDFINPYRGLYSYDKNDKHLFFGRKVAIDELIEKVKKNNLTIVIGASGTGKSSLVKAGLLPKLEEDFKTPNIPIILPGRSPLSELMKYTEGGYKILVIDQFEQLITQSEPKEVEGFWTELVKLVEADKMIILTIRIDYEKQLNIPNRLKDDWENGRYLVPPFSAEELREVIITPTYRVGRFIEPISLVDKIISEVIHYPGSLPLLSFTMQQLFLKSNEAKDIYRKITKDDYKELGGVIGALQKSADEVFLQLSPEEQQTMQKMMLRMVSLTGGETAGRRVMLPELSYTDGQENERVAKVIKALDKSRLIRFDKNSYIEPSHDALVRSWKQMQDWIKAFGFENIALISKLSVAVSEYFPKPSEDKLWAQTANLKQANTLLEARFLNTHEEQFVGLSLKLETDRFDASEKRRKEAESAREEAERQTTLAMQEKKRAEQQTDIALQEKRRADEEKQNAEQQKDIAVQEKRRAEKQTKLAQYRSRIAGVLAIAAIIAGIIALVMRNQAIENAKIATTEKANAEASLQNARIAQKNEDMLKVNNLLLDAEVLAKAKVEVPYAEERFTEAFALLAKHDTVFRDKPDIQIELKSKREKLETEKDRIMKMNLKSEKK